MEANLLLVLCTMWSWCVLIIARAFFVICTANLFKALQPAARGYVPLGNSRPATRRVRQRSWVDFVYYHAAEYASVSDYNHTENS